VAFLNGSYQEKLQAESGLRSPKFSFSVSNELEKILKKQERILIDELGKVRKKLVRAIYKHWPIKSKSEKLAEVTLQDDDVSIILEAVRGNELTGKLVEGMKETWLMGYREVAEGLGRSDGEYGTEGIFDFNSMPEDAFEAAKQAGNLISEKTLQDMMYGISSRAANQAMESILYSGLSRRLTSSDMAKNLSSAFKNMEAWKSSEIIRTELPRAYNYGRISAAKNDGLTKARIMLGGKPCPWCENNAPFVQTLDDAALYMEVHHPNNDCTVVPMIDYEYYGLPEPEFWPDGVDTTGSIEIPERFAHAKGSSGIKRKAPEKTKPKKPAAKMPKLKPIKPLPLPTPREKLVESAKERTARLASSKYRELVRKLDEVLPDKYDKSVDAFLLENFNCKLRSARQYNKQWLIDTLTGFSKVYDNLDEAFLAKLMKPKTADDIAGFFELRLKMASKHAGPHELGVFGETTLSKIVEGKIDKKIIDRWISLNPKSEWGSAITNFYDEAGLIHTRVGTGVHEISHHLWDNGLNNELRKSYVTDVVGKQLEEGIKPITQYSYDSLILRKFDEHFCESMKIYLTNPSVLRRYNREAYDWLEENVFTSK